MKFLLYSAKRAGYVGGLGSVCRVQITKERHMPDVKIDLPKIDLNRFKRDAKRSAKLSGLKYCAVLNDHARMYGFETFENLQAKVREARSATSLAQTDPELEALLTWFRSHFTPIAKISTRVSPQIAKSLRNHLETRGRLPCPPVEIADEIDFGYDVKPFQTTRHPQALMAEMLLETEGMWVANAWLDSLKIRKGGLWGDGQDDVIGDRITLSLARE